MKLLILTGILVLDAMVSSSAAKTKFEYGGQSTLMRYYKSMDVTKKTDLQKYEECIDKSNGVTSSMMDCSGNEIDNQDDQLNEYYKKLIAELNKKEKNELRSAQRSWIRDRDRTCDKISDEEGGGSLGAVIYNECILFITVNRKNKLLMLIKK